MREHLFRGFHPDENGTTEITLNGEKIKGEWVYWDIFGRTNNEIRVKVSGGQYTTYRVDFEHIITETICEYTRLIDKNGKKIFEWHIVKAKSSEREKEAIYLVRFDDTSLWFGFKSPNSGYVHSLDDLLQKELGDEIDFEIIGNIFENPELLK